MARQGLPARAGHKRNITARIWHIKTRKILPHIPPGGACEGSLSPSLERDLRGDLGPLPPAVWCNKRR